MKKRMQSDGSLLNANSCPADRLRNNRGFLGRIDTEDSAKVQKRDQAIASNDYLQDPGNENTAHDSTRHYGHDFSEVPAVAVVPSGWQAKLAIGGPNDSSELEADSIADQVVRISDAQISTNRDSNPSEHNNAVSAIAPRSTLRESADSVGNDFLSQIGPGSQIDASTRRYMEERLDRDFSNIRVHTDAPSAASARSINARAFTVGQDIVFAEGEYSPTTHQGKHLLAHELTHTIQQANTGLAINRLIRSPYPWRGIVTPAIGANIRSSPNSNDPSNIIDSIPRGQPVTVRSTSGQWLNVESSYRGPTITGFVFHELIDDATSSSMAASVGTSMVWRPSGPGSGTDFERWASAPTETPFPPITPATVMNCWEAVLLSAYRSGALNWKWINRLYVSTPQPDWVAAMSRGRRKNYAVPGPNLSMPQRGDLVFFDGIAHVALATGNGSEVFTFWPPPNTPFVHGGTPDKVKVFTIEDLAVWWESNMPPAPVIEFAAPAW